MTKILVAIAMTWLALAGSALLMVRDAPSVPTTGLSALEQVPPDLCRASKGKGKRKAVDCFEPCTQLVCDRPDPTCSTCRCEPIPNCEP